MKTCNKECAYFKSIGNTKETGQGLCSFFDSYQPAKLNEKCFLTPKEYTCGDCDRLNNDFACMTCVKTDSAYHNGHLCGGFIDKQEVAVEAAIRDWVLRGYDVDTKIEAIKTQILGQLSPILEV